MSPRKTSQTLKCKKCGGCEVFNVDSLICWRCCNHVVVLGPNKWWNCIKCGMPMSAMYVAELDAVDD